MNLSQVLQEAKIDVSQWSAALGTKMVEDLQVEIDSGETRLQSIEGVLTRVVKVVTVDVQIQIGDRLFRLVEDKQIFFTGAVRKRGLQSLSEKVKHNELPKVAARRALDEEIGLVYKGEMISIGNEVKQQNSPSYPGLSCRYQIFNYQIVLGTADLNRLRFAEIQAQKMSLFTLEVI
jgi:hypothetical protein